jgi:hypothetical protein
MEAAQLKAMTLDELRRLATGRGVPDAARLERAALVAALSALADAPPAHAHAAYTDEPWRHTTPPGAPTSVLPARPADYDSETMARVYLEQGLAERAVEIYRELVAARPGDAALVGRLAEAERAAEATRQKRPPPEARRRQRPPTDHEPFGILDYEELPEAYNVDEVEVLFRDPFSVFAYWEVTENGLAAARDHLGEEAGDSRLVLRVFATSAPGVPGGELVHTRDFPLEGWRGRRYLPSPRSGVRLRAATGLVAPSGLFALIANSSLVRVPPSEPAPHDPRAIEWMEVRPSRGRSLQPEPIAIVRRVPWGRIPGAEAGRFGLPVGAGPETPSGIPGAAPTSPGAVTSPGGPTSPGRGRSGGQ